MLKFPADWPVFPRDEDEAGIEGIVEMYRSLFDCAPVAMSICAPDGSPFHVNPAFCELFGYSRDELLSGAVDITHPDDGEAGKGLCGTLHNEEAVSSVEKRYIHKSGRVIHGLLKLAPVRNSQGVIERLVAQIIDLSERLELETRIRELAYMDTCTGLPNRLSVFEHLQCVLENNVEARRPAFMYLDLNRFKVINDTFGHQVGDRLLCEVGTRLRQVVPENIYLGRIGGDEFGVVIDDSDDVDIRAIATSIRRSMRTPMYVNKLELPVDVSIGAAVYPRGGLTPDELVTNADIAMYHAKRHNVEFQFYTDSINEYSEKLFVQESRLRKAISRKDFYLDYEHSHHVRDRTLDFREGLLRWRQDGEIVAPHHFVPIAESTGLIRKLDSITLQLASSGEGQESGFRTTAFNLSRLSLLDSSIVDEIAGLLYASGTDPAKLIVEVTETVAVSDPEQINRTLRSIKALGLRIALDDFGTGYTSFSMLQQLPLDLLKLDKTLVHGIEASAVEEHIIRATICIGHELGLSIVAEGVETQTQLDWLIEESCDYVQGWYVAANGFQ